MTVFQPIVGSVLAWAIQDGNYDASRLDYELGFKGALTSWITGESQPNKGQLTKIARRLGRPESFFYLPEPPHSSQKSAKYRQFAGTTKFPGSDTQNGLRNATLLQKTARWVRSETAEPKVAFPKLSTQTTPELAAERLRKWLGWRLSHQTASPDYQGIAVAKALRGKLEDKQILVLHLSLDEEVTRGFSLSDEFAPLLAVNTKDDYKPRVFSYVHELAHLALGEGAVCDVHEDDDAVEKFCNRTAAAFLMPEEDFRGHVLKRLRGRQVATLDDVAAIRGRYRVSLRAAAIRAENLGLASWGLYDRVDQNAELKSGGGGGGQPGNERTKSRIRVDQYGRQFIHTVEAGVNAGVLRQAQAAELLRISNREWTEVLALSHSGLVG